MTTPCPTTRLVLKSRRENGETRERERERTFEDGVKFDHPGRENRLFGEAVDVGQRTDSALDAQPEDVAKILRREATGRNGSEDPIGAQKELRVALHRIVESFVGQDRRLSFKEALQRRNRKRGGYEMVIQ